MYNYIYFLNKLILILIELKEITREADSCMIFNQNDHLSIATHLI